jgi:hypothetical protein
MKPTDPITRAAHAAERAEAPFVFFPDDLAVRFRLEPDEAIEAVRRGVFGPWFSVGGVPAVLRDSLREHLKLRMAQIDDDLKELMRGARGRTGPRPIDPAVDEDPEVTRG